MSCTCCGVKLTNSQKLGVVKKVISSVRVLSLVSTDKPVKVRTPTLKNSALSHGEPSLENAIVH